MGKPFRTIDQQIDLLEKRNLKFKDKEKAREILLKNNYYNLINNYSKFMINSFNSYEDNTYCFFFIYPGPVQSSVIPSLSSSVYLVISFSAFFQIL